MSGTVNKLIDLIEELLKIGIIHCDFNEFNILINNDGGIHLIDFPQLISINHRNAEELLRRDIECIKLFFSRKFGFLIEREPRINYSIKIRRDIDLKMSGYNHKETKSKINIRESSEENDRENQYDEIEEEDYSENESLGDQENEESYTSNAILNGAVYRNPTEDYYTKLKSLINN